MQNKYQLAPSADGTKVNLVVFAPSGERVSEKSFDTAEAATAEITAALNKDTAALKAAAKAKADEAAAAKAKAGDKQ